MEEWKAIKDFPDYEVSNLGNVRSYKGHYGQPRLTIPFMKKFAFHKERGYYYTSLINSKGKLCCKDIHRLVGETFLEPIDGKNTIDHLNKNKLDNRLSNLRWANQTEQNVNRNQRQEHYIYKTYNNKVSPYLVEARRHGKRVIQKYCRSLEEAIFIRDEFLRTDPFQAPLTN